MRIAKKYGTVAIVLLTAALCIPRKTYLSPAYDVAVVDSSGKSLPKLKVRWYLQDFSSGNDVESWKEAMTDSGGKTHLDAVTHWISFAGESFGCVRQIQLAGAHAGCGSYVDVSVDTNNFVEIPSREEVVDGTGHSKSLVIRMTRCPSGDWQTCTEALAGKATSPGSR